MKNKNIKIKGEGWYWALLCYCGKNDNTPMICGVYPTKKEAEEVNREVKDCVANHKIRKCKITISLIQRQSAVTKN